MIPPWRINEVLERAENGPICTEKEFDLKILTPKLKEVIKEHDISYDAEEVIPADDSLINDAFKAAFELYLETGTLCLSSHRRIIFDESEIKEALNLLSGKIHVGIGKDSKEMHHRKIEDKTPPFCLLGPMGQACTKEMFIPISIAYIQEPIADGVSAPALDEIEGRLIKIGSPSEVTGSIAHAMMLREAARRAGRPGMFLVSVATAPSDAAQIAASNPEWGERQTDGRFVGALAELKTNFDLLRKMVHFHQYGCYVGALTGPMLGGYAGGPEGTAIVGIAYHLQGLMVHQSHFHCSFPIHLRFSCTTTKELLWATSLISQSIAKCTSIITFAKGKAAAGPCTKMVLFEAAAHGLTGTISGANLYVIAAARNKHIDRTTPVEARMACEVGHSVVGMALKREDANEIAKEILKKYEGRIKDAPLGKKFQECYDAKRIQPTKEYTELYKSVKKELSNIGINFIY